MISSKEIKINHPHLYDDVSPDWDIREKLRAYRALLEEIRNVASQLGTLNIPRMHLKNARFLLGQTLSSIGVTNPYLAGDISRKLGKKEVIEPADIGFKFREGVVPTDEIEIYDFLRYNLEKLQKELEALVRPLAYFDGHQFVYFERTLQEIVLARCYVGETLYKVAVASGYEIKPITLGPKNVNMPDNKVSFQPNIS